KQACEEAHSLSSQALASLRGLRSGAGQLIERKQRLVRRQRILQQSLPVLQERVVRRDMPTDEELGLLHIPEADKRRRPSFIVHSANRRRVLLHVVQRQ